MCWSLLVSRSSPCYPSNFPQAEVTHQSETNRRSTQEYLGNIRAATLPVFLLLTRTKKTQPIRNPAKVRDQNQHPPAMEDRRHPWNKPRLEAQQCLLTHSPHDFRAGSTTATLRDEDTEKTDSSSEVTQQAGGRWNQSQRST